MKKLPLAKILLGVGLVATLILWGNLLTGFRNHETPNSSNKPSNFQYFDDQPKVGIWFGDSYVAGAGATEKSLRMSSIVSRHFGLFEKNLGVGGSGYLGEVREGESATSVCSKNSCQNLQQQLESKQLLKFDIIFVQAGLNDVDKWSKNSPEQIRSFYQKLRQKYAKAVVVAIAPIWPKEETNPNLQKIHYFAQKSVLEINGYYLDLGQPLIRHPEWLAEDGFNPNNKGYQMLADLVIKKLSPILKKVIEDKSK